MADRSALLVAVILGTLSVGTLAAGQKVPVPGREGAYKTSAQERAERRAYDGAPPVVPHSTLGATCVSCHTTHGRAVPGLGFAPASPHGETAGMSDTSRCRQCHVQKQVSEVWRASRFSGLQQDLRHGKRAHPLAPPVIPHKVFMRENCAACHSGPAAREEVRTTHPERQRCRQCHVEQRTTDTFVRK